MVPDFESVLEKTDEKMEEGSKTRITARHLLYAYGIIVVSVYPEQGVLQLLGNFS